MVFCSATFLFVFLPIVFLANLIFRKQSNMILLVSSLIFYAWGEPVFIILMVISILLNYLFGLSIEKSKKKVVRKIITTGSIITDLGALFIFKYSSFFVEILNNLFGYELFVVPSLALPIGISFFTFQELSYLIDVSNGKIKASRKISNVALYIAFFPQLIAGPIVKFSDINMQIEERFTNWEKIADGIRRFIYGLAKKVLIANCLGEFVDKIYGSDISSLSTQCAWIGALAYTFQIYYDFSGYSDMAIGLGYIFGFKLPENFKYPYLSRSISEFWRRWHITLGTWFRDYLYIPLGGNRRGLVRTVANILLVFLLTGLWHGANYTFIIWGLINGLFIVCERLFVYHKKMSIAFSVVYCFLVTTLGWVFFRSDSVSHGFTYISHMLEPWKYYSRLSTRDFIDIKLVLVLVASILGSGIIQIIWNKMKEHKYQFLIWEGWKVCEALYCLILLILSVSHVASNSYNPFIYFQF